MARSPIGDHIPLEQDDFKGIFSRGTSEAVPDRFFIDAQNNKYLDSEITTRDGLGASVFTKTNIIRFFAYNRIGENSRFLVLTTGGNIYDSLTPSTPIWTDASIVDFNVVNYGNKAYITVHDRSKGIAGKSLIVYDGTTARLAAGSPPVGFTITAATSGTPGAVEAGIHLIAVAYVTSTGFITAPGPVTFTQYTAPGGFKLDLSNIQVGPTGTVARILLATKAIPLSLFNGNQFGYEFFFIPNGIIQDNTSTVKTGLSFYDADLADSADYLFDNLSTIPAGLGVLVYSNRLGVWSENGNQFTIRLSTPGQPEVFSSVTGFITIDASDAGSGIQNCTVSRKSLLIATANRIYTTTDNGSDPNTWQVDEADNSAGTSCFGFATVLDARGSGTDRVLFSDPSGLICYEGAVKRPELTNNIDSIWKRVNKAAFNLVQVINDPLNNRVYVSVPLDAATAISHVLVGDYSKAHTIYGTLQADLFKWDIWTFPSAVMSMQGVINATTKAATLYFALAGGNIYPMLTTATDDFGNAIDHFIQSSLKTARSGWICHFGGLKLRVTGTGTLLITLQGEDNSNPVSPPSFTLSNGTGKELDRSINYINERMSVKLRVNTFGNRFTLSRLTVWGKELWLRRQSSFNT